MGRSYAGVLGPLAFAILTARGLLSGAGAEGTMLAAMAGLAIFSSIGYIAGRTAEYIVLDAVQARVAGEIAAYEAETKHLSNSSQAAAKRPAA